MSSYSRALEFRLDLLEDLKGPHSTIPKKYRGGPSGSGESIVQALEYGDTYYWAPEMDPLLNKAVASAMPETRWSQERLPSPLGFMYFEKPIGWKNDADGRWAALRWITWRLGIITIPDGRYSVVNLAGGWSGGYLDARPVPAETAIVMGQWPEDYTYQRVVEVLLKWSVETSLDPALSDLACILIAGVFASVLALMDQRIATTTTQRADRATRRRLERQGWRRDPLIKVIELRRRVAAQRRDGQVDPVDWSCRWLVGAHWHKFWVGSGDDRRLEPRFVLPYVKGPEGKPLKEPSAKVFAVVR